MIDIYRSCIAATLLAVLTSAPSGPVQSAEDVAAVLQRQTQEMLDAIAAGDRAPWTRYLHEQMISTVEDGTVKSRTQLIDEIRALPAGVWGKLRVTAFKATVVGDTAIATYVADEDEGYFGQVLHAKYATTDTWLRVGSSWQLAASAVLALRTDPPAITPPEAALDQYVGVYALTPEITYTIRRTPQGLTGQRTGRDPVRLDVELADCLFTPGQPRLRKIFQRDAQGRITGFVERRESWDIAWQRLR